MTTEKVTGNITRELLDKFIKAGIRPVGVYKGKVPIIEGDTGYSYDEPASEEEIARILAGESFGIAGGTDFTDSGFQHVYIDVDNMAYWEPMLEACPILKGFPMQSTGKGRHISLLVCSKAPIKSAQLTKTISTDPNNKKGYDVAIETRGYHSIIVSAPSPHYGKDGKPDGKFYTPIQGNMWEPTPISLEEWEDISNKLVGLSTWKAPKSVVANASTSITANTPQVQYNLKVDVVDVLVRNGYKKDGGRLINPGSTSGIPGVSVSKDGKAYSHNSSDILSDGLAHDAFDCMRILECNGDWGEAYRRAENELGIKPLDIVFGKATGDNAAKSSKKSLISYGEDLLTMNLAPLRFAVPNLIPQGMTVLAGSLKIGKSWLSLQMCIAVATGGTVLGEKCDQGEAVYLSLEDGPRRLKERLMKCLPGATATPSGLYVMGAGSIEPLMAGGMEQLQNWVSDHPDTRLIVIDTMEHVKGGGLPDGKTKNAYEADVAFWKGLQVFSQTAGVAILLITHLRKEQAGGDQFNRVTGSAGITGTADTNIMLSRDRGSKDAVLTLTSREIEERELDVTFNTSTFKWELACMPAPGVFNLAIVQATISTMILTVLRTHGELSPTLIHGFLVDEFQVTKTAKDIRVYLIRMVEKGEIEKSGRGLYRLKATR